MCFFERVFGEDSKHMRMRLPLLCQGGVCMVTLQLTFEHEAISLHAYHLGTDGYGCWVEYGPNKGIVDQRLLPEPLQTHRHNTSVAFDSAQCVPVSCLACCRSATAEKHTIAWHCSKLLLDACVLSQLNHTSIPSNATMQLYSCSTSPALSDLLKTPYLINT